uniref:Uncharacterized protein n=1 Tax=Varanus komodoensis TaxID=61221 RepID=A0A8D2KY97_VARKO
MAGAPKKTTGLAAASETPHENFRILYTNVLNALENVPKDAAYRRYTEKMLNQPVIRRVISVLP